MTTPSTIPHEIPWECQCGALAGTIRPDHLYGQRSVCLCDDCQAYAHSLGCSDFLDANGGTEIIPLTPSRIKIKRGEDQLRCLRLNPKGMYRWYTHCCRTPVGNMMSASWVPFIGFPVKTLRKTIAEDKLTQFFGPIQLRMMAKFGRGSLPSDAVPTVTLPFLLRVMQFTALGLMRGERRPSPFHKEDGRLKAEPRVLTVSERDVLRPLCGPQSKTN